jgi:hypothetical protein
MRTHSREDTAKARGARTILPFLILAATPRTRQVTDCAVLHHIGLPAAASAARLHNARPSAPTAMHVCESAHGYQAIFVPSTALASPGYDGQPALYSYIAGLEMNVLNCRSEPM